MKKRLINLQPVKDKVREKLIAKYNTTEFINMTDSIDIKLDVKDILEEYMKEQETIEPEVYITTEAYVKMRTLVDKTTTELGWYGFVSKAPGLTNIYIIEDIIVYPQKVTGATCEQDEDRLFEFEMSLTDEQINTRRFQGHSHVNMGVTPSGVDENFYQDLLSQVTDYYIIMVTNKRNENHIRFYDMEHNIMYTDLELKILLNDGTDVEDWYESSSTNLTRPTPVGSAFTRYPDTETHFSTGGKIYDPYLMEYITEDEYKSTYGIPYTGQFDELRPIYYSGKHGKKNKKGKL